MSVQRETRKAQRTPEEAARLRAVREQFQREKPGPEDAAAALVPLGEVLELHRVAAELRKERERQGVTLADLATRTGIDQATLSKLETGRNGNPTLATLARVARSLGKVFTFRLEDAPAGPRAVAPAC